MTIVSVFVMVCVCVCVHRYNLISAREKHLLSTHMHTYTHVSMGTKQPLYSSIVGKRAEVDAYCVVCVWGVGLAV